MATKFINIVHPDLPGQVGRVAESSLPVWKDRGWKKQPGPKKRERQASKEQSE